MPTDATSEIATRILSIRGQRVMLDSDLAAVYGVSTRRFNEQVRRNEVRFPGDFSFELTDQEVENLKSQFATSSWMAGAHGGRRKRPRVFTEYGAIMAASILNSPRAVQMSVYVVRAFVRLREVLASRAARPAADKWLRTCRKATPHSRSRALSCPKFCAISVAKRLDILFLRAR
jgi:hypothetical protein